MIVLLFMRKREAEISEMRLALREMVNAVYKGTADDQRAAVSHAVDAWNEVLHGR